MAEFIEYNFLIFVMSYVDIIDGVQIYRKQKLLDVRFFCESGWMLQMLEMPLSKFFYVKGHMLKNNGSQEILILKSSAA